MQITKTYASKSNTISRDEEYVNMGLNPVMELNYGKMLTRGMIYFDHNKVKQMVEDKIYPDINKLHHTLKMTNCSSIEYKGETRYWLLKEKIIGERTEVIYQKSGYSEVN